MYFFIIIGLFLVIVGLVMILIHSPTWPTGGYFNRCWFGCGGLVRMGLQKDICR